MYYENFVEYFLLGCSGAACAEILKVYELRGKLSLKKYQTALRSPVFWAVTFGMLIASGFIAWSVNALSQLAPWQVVLSGIGARALIRAPVEAHTANPKARLGGNSATEDEFSLKDIFR
jgi:hypothetical protein